MMKTQDTPDGNRRVSREGAFLSVQGVGAVRSIWPKGEAMIRWILLPTLLLVACGTAFAGKPVFSDVPEGHWAHDAVERCGEVGIISIPFDGPGVPLYGNKVLTRFNAAAVFAKLLDLWDDADKQREAAATKLAAALADLRALRQRVEALQANVEGLKTKVTGYRPRRSRVRRPSE